VSPYDYEFVRNLVRERSGLVLASDKQYLVESRLLPVARKAGLTSVSDVVQRLKRPDSQAFVTEVVEAMMTNESFFFRDKIPFEHFRDMIVPTLMAARAGQRRIRIWCSAASTGQEPYSLAMCVKELGQLLAGWRIEILATDLSTEVLEKAKSGIYSQFEVQRGLPIQMGCPGREPARSPGVRRRVRSAGHRSRGCGGESTRRPRVPHRPPTRRPPGPPSPVAAPVPPGRGVDQRPLR
jgi:chemotaxis protein methyltransferase CheR